VIKYHAPGLAPVITKEGAYHIDKNKLPAYQKRFIKAFGFYDLLAAVADEQGFLHIHPDGSALYENRYSWCGNFQEKHCGVKDKNGLYFHINSKGQRAYNASYTYVGDFKDGMAVICSDTGLHTHIDYQGNYTHDKWFIDLDIFHKNYARAKDENGWFHINISGEQLYDMRYNMVEPFYNGVARVETKDGALLTIDTTNTIISTIREPIQKSWQSLSGDMVGFWRTEIIATAIKLNLFDYLPNSTTSIAFQLNISEKHIERLLRALWELALIKPNKNSWQVTTKGKNLSPQSEKFLAGAAIMWSDVNHSNWTNLETWMRENYDEHHAVFKTSASDEKLKHYHQAIDGYAQNDFACLTKLVDWHQHKKIIGVGRSAKVILDNILLAYQNIEASLLGESYISKYLEARCTFQTQDILQDWVQKADAIILPRVLHYWPEKQALSILNNARGALLPHSKIYILEMLLTKENPNGSLLDINMFVETGGQLRYLEDFENLCSKVSLTLMKNISINDYINLLVLQ
jgi:predicted transcriptional regulator